MTDAMDTPPKASRTRRVTKAIVVVAAIAGAVALWRINNPPPEPTFEELVDLPNQSFYLHEQGVPQKKVQLTDGVYRDGDETIRLVGEADSRFDVNGDHVPDVVAVLESTKEPRWRAAYAWVATEEVVRPVEWPLAWQWNCVAENDPGAEELTLDRGVAPWGYTVTQNRENTCGRVDSGNTSGLIFARFIMVHDDVPIRTPDVGRTRFATEACIGGDRNSPDRGIDYLDVTDAVTPLVLPKGGSPPVSGPDDNDPELEIRFRVDADTDPDPTYLGVHNGYVPVAVEWLNFHGCGWAPWDEVRPLIEAAH